jgi:hypothetical protein
VFASSSLPPTSILLKGLDVRVFTFGSCLIFSFAGSYQQRGGGVDTKKSGGKGGGRGAGLGDQPVVFHKTIKSSGYGKDQPVLPPPPPLLLLLSNLTAL